jgi:hypothetical protein
MSKARVSGPAKSRWTHATLPAVRIGPKDHPPGAEVFRVHGKGGRLCVVLVSRAERWIGWLPSAAAA